MTNLKPYNMTISLQDLQKQGTITPTNPKNVVSLKDLQAQGSITPYNSSNLGGSVKQAGVSNLDVAKQIPVALADTFQNFGTGIIKGVGHTLAGGASLGEKILQAPLKAVGIKTAPQTGSEQLGLQQKLAPTNTAQKIGFGAEQLGEFLIPGDTSIEVGKTLETGAKALGAGEKLAKVASVVGRSLAEGTLFGGQTALQTGGVGKEVKTQALVGAALPIAGALIKPAVSLIGKGISEALGKSTGSQAFSIEEAFKNPNVQKYLKEVGVDSGAGLQQKALEDARTSLQKMVNNRRNTYLADFEKTVKGNTGSFDDILSGLRDKVKDLAKPENFDIGLKGDTTGKKINLVDLRKTTITEGKEAVQKGLEDVFSWSDTSAKGLDTLKKRISDYVDQAKPGTPGYALLNQIKNNLKTGLEEGIPGYKVMTTKYHEASDVLTDITKGLSLGTKTSSDTAARKLMMAVRQNQEFRKELLNTLQQTGGKDITGKLAAASLAPWTAKGIAGAVQTVAGGAGAMEVLTQPASWPILTTYLAASSPRLVGEFVSLMGNISRVGEKIANVDEIATQLKRIFGEAETDFKSTGSLSGKSPLLTGKIQNAKLK